MKEDFLVQLEAAELKANPSTKKRIDNFSMEEHKTSKLTLIGMQKVDWSKNGS
jgi:hypothetical protein